MGSADESLSSFKTYGGSYVPPSAENHMMFESGDSDSDTALDDGLSLDALQALAAHAAVVAQPDRRYIVPPLHL